MYLQSYAGNKHVPRLQFMIHVMLFSILLLLLLFTFMQDIYNYIPETNLLLGYIVLQLCCSYNFWFPCSIFCTFKLVLS